MTDQRQQTLDQVRREFESIRLDAAAYSASVISTKLDAYYASSRTKDDLEHLNDAVIKELSAGDGHRFTEDQASAFVQRYTPVAAFDKEGAGIVYFKDTVTGTIAPAVRGSLVMEDYVADIAIAQNRLPTYQTTLLINNALQVTAPEGTLVPQFRVVGITSSLDDAIAATMTTMLPLNPYANPQYEISGYVRGTGQAVGACVNPTGHSEAAPEAQVIGAILSCRSSTVYNGPGVSVVVQTQGTFYHGRHHAPGPVV